MNHRHNFQFRLLGRIKFNKVFCYITTKILKNFPLKKRCKFPQKCTPYLSYTKINSNDQLDLKGSCLSSCSGKSLNYTFSLYQLDPILKEWVLFTNNSYFYNTGLSNEYLVVLRDLFRDFPNQVYWKVESNIHLTTFADDSLTASSSIIFYVNFSPLNGMCSISPITGTTNTRFTIYCNNWLDKDGEIISYSYYGNKYVFFQISKSGKKIYYFSSS